MSADQELKVQSVVPSWDELPTYVKSALNQVAADEGFVNFTLTVEPGSNIGDGFVSIMLRVTVSGCKRGVLLSEKGKKHVLKLICKLPPLSQARREQFGSLKLFEREIAVYNKFLPLIETFQIEKEIMREEGFFDFPKCYYAAYNTDTDEAILVLEDLGESDYNMWNKFQPMEINHCKKVVSSLGRYHALSLVLRRQEPEKFEQFKQYQDLLSDIICKPEVQDMWNNFFNQAISAFGEDETYYRERLQTFRDNLTSEIIEIVDGNNAEPYTVLGHGDCWINNFMFRTNGHFPTDVVLIDFQVSRYVSPILDLMYFIFVSTNKETRAEHYTSLMKLYHDSLSSFIRRCGENPDELFPFAAFQDQLVRFGRFGLPMALMLLPIITIPSSEVPDMDKMTELIVEQTKTGVKSEEYLEMERKMQETSLKVASRLRDVIVDVFAYGYFK